MRKSLITAYEYMKANSGKAVTPAALNKALGVGDYASKHISLLRKRVGCTIEVTREGRDVVAYTYMSGPETLPVKASKAKKAPAVKAAKPVKAKPAPVAKAAPKPVAPKVKVAPSVPVVERTNLGEVGSFAVDNDFDTMGGIDLRRIND
jgi:hypothetical protein